MRQNLAIAPDCARANSRAQLAKLNLAKFLAQFVLRLPSLHVGKDGTRNYELQIMILLPVSQLLQILMKKNLQFRNIIIIRKSAINSQYRN